MTTKETFDEFEHSEIIRSERPLGKDFDLEKATVSIEGKPLAEETDWMNFNGYEAKFRRVPAFAYAKARQHLRRLMRDNKPEPPTVSRGTRQMVNKNDPYYLDQLSLWTSEWEDLQRDVISTTSILVGIILKKQVPPDSEWLHHVIDIMGAMGLDAEEDIFASFKYNTAKMRELLFKQYVILAAPEDMEKFNQFQGGNLEDDEGDTDGENDYVEAVDMFQPK